MPSNPDNSTTPPPPPAKATEIARTEAKRKLKALHKAVDADEKLRAWPGVTPEKKCNLRLNCIEAAIRAASTASSFGKPRSTEDIIETAQSFYEFVNPDDK